MRLFIAIPLSEEMKASILKSLHEMKTAGVKGNYVPRENLHLTLAFIGETKEKDRIIEAMKSVKLKPFRLMLSGCGNFGDLLWIGLKGNQGLAALVKDVRSALDAAGIPHDGKAFLPHITVIRRASGDFRKIKPPEGGMTVKKVSLMNSEQKDRKRVYTELFSIPDAAKTTDVSGEY